MGLRDIWARSLEGREAASPDPVAGSGPYQAQGLPAKPTARNRALADCADVMSNTKKIGGSAVSRFRFIIKADDE
jgi:hypothetical protein